MCYMLNDKTVHNFCSPAPTPAPTEPARLESDSALASGPLGAAAQTLAFGAALAAGLLA